MKVCLAPTHLLWNARLGGHAWVFLNWALGLQALGCEVILLEKARREMEPATLHEHLELFGTRIRDLGLDARIALIPADGRSGRTGTDADALPPHCVALEAAFEDTDLFLNFRYALPGEIIHGFRRSALIDIDPGLLQIWIHGGTSHPRITTSTSPSARPWDGRGPVSRTAASSGITSRPRSICRPGPSPGLRTRLPSPP